MVKEWNAFGFSELLVGLENSSNSCHPLNQLDAWLTPAMTTGIFLEHPLKIQQQIQFKYEQIIYWVTDFDVSSLQTPHKSTKIICKHKIHEKRFATVDLSMVVHKEEIWNEKEKH